jgi:hypothetical protein
MVASTHYTKAVLRTLYRTAVDRGVSLLEAIDEALKARVEATEDGLVVSSTESDGSRVAFSNPTTGAAPSPKDLVETFSALRDYYDRTYDALVAAGTTSPTDAEIYLDMISTMAPVRSVAATYGDLRS